MYRERMSISRRARNRSFLPGFVGLALPLVLAGCPKKADPDATPSASAKPAVSAAPSAIASASAPPADPSAAPPSTGHAVSLAGLKAPAPVTRGPIKVVGFPKTVYTGMNDPAGDAGFSADGADFGYCDDTTAADEPRITCVTIDPQGKRTTRSSEATSKGAVHMKVPELKAWMAARKLPKVGPAPKGEPPKLTGDWDFADIELHVADGKLGGAVDKEPPVFPVTFKVEAPLKDVPYGFVALNALALSPDGKDLGAVGLFFCGEWCNEHDVRRYRVGEFAALVYNDTGMKHHTKNDFARSAELFRKAVFADPNAKLPTYNLACALARLSDETEGKVALERAIGLDPKVKERAPKDKDFAKVLDKPWFKALVGG
jgi:hypothetical protein